MTALLLIGGLLATALLLYLVTALLWPEWFT